MMKIEVGLLKKKKMLEVSQLTWKYLQIPSIKIW